MPLFQYDSFTRRGKRVKGTIDAASQSAAKQILQGQGLMPIKIILMGMQKKGSWFSTLFEKKVDVKTQVMFTKQLSVLLKSGVPLLKALELLVEQFEKKFRRVLIDIKDGVKAGESFGTQLEQFPRIFSNVYIQLVKAGEASGKLHMILERLTDYLEKEEETNRQIKKAMAYPTFMIVFSVAIVLGLMAFLVPKLTEMFLKMKQDLPGPTLFLKNMSDFLLNNINTLSLSFVAIVGVISYWASTTSGRYKIDELFLRFPVTSYFSKTKAVVQFSKTLGLLLESGVNLSDALGIVCKIVDNKVLVKKLEEAKSKIIKEGKITKYLKETGIFPSIAIYMIGTGEESGKLDQMLLTVGKDYDVSLKDLTDSLVSKLGPIMTIVVGLIIAFIVVSVFLPIFEMGNMDAF